MGLRPEFENVRSSIQHRVPPPDIERVVADVRSGGDSTCFPLLGWVLGVDFLQGASDQSGSCSWTCFGTSTLWSESSIWKLCWCIRPTRHVQDHLLLLQEARSRHMIADSRKRQNANSRRQSDTAHLAAPPETPTESETYQSPYSIGLWSITSMILGALPRPTQIVLPHDSGSRFKGWIRLVISFPPLLQLPLTLTT